MTAALEGGEWSAARPGRTLPPGKTRYSFYRRLGGPQGRSGGAENLVPTGIRSRTVQPVVSRNTDWATADRDRLIYVAINTKGLSWRENEHCTADCHPSEFSNWCRPLSSAQSHVNVVFVGLSCAEREGVICRYVVVQLWKGSAYSWAVSNIPRLLRTTTNTRPVSFVATEFEWWYLGNKNCVRDFRLPQQCKWDIRSGR